MFWSFFRTWSYSCRLFWVMAAKSGKKWIFAPSCRMSVSRLATSITLCRSLKLWNLTITARVNLEVWGLGSLCALSNLTLPALVSSSRSWGMLLGLSPPASLAGKKSSGFCVDLYSHNLEVALSAPSLFFSKASKCWSAYVDIFSITKILCSASLTRSVTSFKHWEIFVVISCSIFSNFSSIIVACIHCHLFKSLAGQTRIRCHASISR